MNIRRLSVQLLCLVYACGLSAQTSPTFHEGCRADSASALPGLPSSRRGGAVFAAHLRAGPSLGQGDQSGGAGAEDAAVVRRSALRQILERQLRSNRARSTRSRPGWMPALRKGDPKDLPPPREFADGWAIPKPDAVIELPSAFRDSGDRRHRISAHPDPGAFQDRQMGAIRGSAAHRPFARAPHHRVHPRARIGVAEGGQARDPLRPGKTEGGRQTRTPASCRATFWWATLPASRRNASSRGRRS